jgi:hypothetical protein
MGHAAVLHEGEALRPLDHDAAIRTSDGNGYGWTVIMTAAGATPTPT